jgi:5-formyltetrahydrofolate cyclo-ligase
VIRVSTSVDTLRQSIRRRRRQLGIGARCRAAKRLVLEITATDIYQRSQHIALYLPNDGELDCRPLIKRAWRDGKDCYLPVLAPKNTCPPMLFSRYSPGDLLVKNRYGILEMTKSERLIPSALDLVLVPLVGFDSEGNRIGMGGGYYDRSFAFKADYGNKKVRKNYPCLLGLAYRLQKINRIKPQPWDVRLDQVLMV